MVPGCAASWSEAAGRAGYSTGFSDSGRNTESCVVSPWSDQVKLGISIGSSHRESAKPVWPTPSTWVSGRVGGGSPVYFSAFSIPIYTGNLWIEAAFLALVEVTTMAPTVGGRNSVATEVPA